MSRYETIMDYINKGHRITFSTAYKTIVVDNSNKKLFTTNSKGELFVKGVDVSWTTIKYY
jgi:phosphatidate phosphatase PAH1